MERDEILTKLKENTCSVLFTKVGGEERKMLCTLKADLLPVVEESTTEKKRHESLESVKVFDLEKSAWRAFRIDSIKSFEVV